MPPRRHLARHLHAGRRTKGGQNRLGIGFGIEHIHRTTGAKRITRRGVADQQTGGLQMLLPRFAAVEGGADFAQRQIGKTARLIAGSLGTLGIVLEVSLKVLPRPVAEATLRFELDEATAIRRVSEWGGQPLPVSATLWQDGVLHLRREPV